MGSWQGAELKANVIPARLEGDLGRFLDQARQQPLLAAEEERELAVRWRDTKDPEAARRLVASHLRLVVKIARGYDGYGFPLADLIAEGNVGLVQALTKFDPERGFRFATYAMWWIKAAIQEHILHNWSLVKLGTTAAQKKLFFNLRRLKSQLGEIGAGDLPPEAVGKIARDLDVTETRGDRDEPPPRGRRRLAQRPHGGGRRPRVAGDPGRRGPGPGGPDRRGERDGSGGAASWAGRSAC